MEIMQFFFCSSYKLRELNIHRFLVNNEKTVIDCRRFIIRILGPKCWCASILIRQIVSPEAKCRVKLNNINKLIYV